MTETDTALSLMRMALALLDNAGDGLAIAGRHLQSAIDAMTGATPPPGRRAASLTILPRRWLAAR